MVLTLVFAVWFNVITYPSIPHISDDSFFVAFLLKELSSHPTPTYWFVGILPNLVTNLHQLSEAVLESRTSPKKVTSGLFFPISTPPTPIVVAQVESV
jgi:hypothetical protein